MFREGPRSPPKQRKKRTRRPLTPTEEIPVHPQRRKDDPNRKYKVLYTDPRTGDWFYEISTRDLIGHHKGLRVDDIQDIID